MNIYIKAMEIGSDNLDNGITYPHMITRLEQELKAKDSESKYKVLVTPDSKYNFAMWFVDNFSCHDFVSNYNSNNSSIKSQFHRYYFNLQGNLLDENDYLKVERIKQSNRPKEEYRGQFMDYNATLYLNKFFSHRFFLNGSTNKQYIDYLELSEARQSSKEALKKAEESIKLTKDSILYAKGALIIAIITSAVSICISLFKSEPKYPQPPYDVKLNEPINVKVNNPVQTYPFPQLDSTTAK